VILIGMFDSPFVRRVAVSMKLLGQPFEHRNWSVGKDADLIREYHPQARVPVLVLDSGEALIESSAIVDYLDELAGPDRALLPARGDARRRALKLVALATSCVDKGILLAYENIFRSADKRSPEWIERCTRQMHSSMALLNEACGKIPEGQWLTGPRLTQADIALTCVATYLSEAVGLDMQKHPAAAAHVARCETLPEFKAFYVPFFAPKI